MAVKLSPDARYDRANSGIGFPFSAILWARADALPDGFSCLFYAGGIANSHFLQLLLREDDVGFSVWDDTFTERIGGPPVDLGSWLFLGLTVSAGGTLTLYWRTEAQTALTSATGTYAGQTPLSDDYLYVGSNRNAPSFLFTFDGAFSYVRAFTSELSAAQVLTESRSTAAAAPVGAAGADWPMADTSGADISGNGNDLLLDEGDGAATTASDPDIDGAFAEGTAHFPIIVDLSAQGAAPVGPVALSSSARAPLTGTASAASVLGMEGTVG